MSYLAADTWSLKLFSGYSAPSSILLGLGFYLLPLSIVGKLSAGLAFMYLPLLFRFLGASSLSKFSGQVAVAKVLGADLMQIIYRIVWPQFRPTALFLSGLGAIWAAGDFAFSSVVTGEISNLALTAKSLLGSYHLELALVYVWLSFLVGLSVFLIFMGLSYVANQKLIR
jgi:ABC-type Fe3+ transport system permease subunit